MSSNLIYLDARRLKSGKFHPDFLSHAVKFPATQIFWECSSSKGAGRLQLVRGNFKASVYTDNVKEYLKPTTRDNFIYKKMDFSVCIRKLPYGKISD